MKSTIIITSVLCVLIACNQKVEKEPQEKVVGGSVKTILSKDRELIDTLTVLNESKKWTVYTYENDTFFQQVKLRYVDPDTINFVLETINHQLEEKSILKGKASKRVNPTGNAELSEDEDGNAFFVDIFDYHKGDCWVELAIESVDAKRFEFFEMENCQSLRNKLVPFESQGILLRAE